MAKGSSPQGDICVGFRGTLCFSVQKDHPWPLLPALHRGSVMAGAVAAISHPWAKPREAQGCWATGCHQTSHHIKETRSSLLKRSRKHRSTQQMIHSDKGPLVAGALGSPVVFPRGQECTGCRPLPAKRREWWQTGASTNGRGPWAPSALPEGRPPQLTGRPQLSFCLDWFGFLALAAR